MAKHSSSNAAGLAKLSQDMETLINNRQGSDIQFKVGGGTLLEDGATICNESTAVTLYAHSIILRCRSKYFAAMLDEDKNWKESSKGVIYKPNISPKTFQDVLHYIYTGDISTITSENIIELITAADEMDLEELVIMCKAELMRIVKYIFLDEDDKTGETFKSTKSHIPIDVAIRTHIIPVLNIASSHLLSDISQEIYGIVLPHISLIITSPDAYTAFLNGISSENLLKIISSNNLELAECDIWDLALSWGCSQTNLSKTAVEARLKRISGSTDDDEDYEDGSSGTAAIGMDVNTEDDIQKKPNHPDISIAQLKRLKAVIVPLIPHIRFSLLKAKDYARIVSVVNYFLSYRRSVELQEFFLDSDHGKELDSPRISSNIFTESIIWKLLRKNIFETGGISGCASSNDLKFRLLFRASHHAFLATTFHKRCDNKGPTLVLVRSMDGYLFGGVNFISWNSSDSFSTSSLNFLFSLPDGHHRKDLTIHKIIRDKAKYAVHNHPNNGPNFGTGADLYISNNANLNQYSFTKFSTYKSESSYTSLTTATNHFTVSDYEVFAISR